MPGSVESLVYCWSYWLGKFNSDIWNMVPGCLMWIVWTERNRRSFEDTEKSLAQLQALCQKTLFDWFRCWGFSDCSTILEFISSLSIALLSFSFLLVAVCLSVAFPCVHHHEHLVFVFFYFSVCLIILLLTIKKKVSGTIKETSWVVIHPKLRTGLLKYKRQIHFLQSLQNQVFPTYASNNSNSYDCRTFQYPNHKSTQATHYVLY